MPRDCSSIYSPNIAQRRRATANMLKRSVSIGRRRPDQIDLYTYILSLVDEFLTHHFLSLTDDLIITVWYRNNHAYFHVYIDLSPEKCNENRFAPHVLSQVFFFLSLDLLLLHKRRSFRKDPSSLNLFDNARSTVVLCRLLPFDLRSKSLRRSPCITQRSNILQEESFFVRRCSETVEILHGE